MSGFEHVTVLAEDSKPLTEEEKEILEAVKKHVGEEGMKQLSHESLVRYVRGYEFESKTGGKEKWLQVACAEADKTVKWRKEIDANTLEVRTLPNWEEFQASWVTGVFGTDNEGHPIIVERYHEFKLDKIVSMFKPEDLTIYQAKNLENVQRRKAKISEKLGKLIYKHVYIFDAGGLGMDILKWRQHMQAIFHVAQYYYPETLYRLFIVNAPMVFRMIWSAASPLIHPITRAKIKVLAGKALKDLKANGIEESQIPASIGGTYQPNAAFEEELAAELAKLTLLAKEPATDTAKEVVSEAKPNGVPAEDGPAKEGDTA
eukprot:GGOE01042831.1.p1 GENE.GGOE01042831.1~~GGOE01042831.1.p1  ORF type:complete len:317 (+),score=91.54 GGOE01042831.1:19-969(+)